MTTESTRERETASPPTQRVVAVVELLLASPAPLPVSAITARLGLNRSTCTAILATLDELGWVARRGDLTYGPGPGLLPLANAIRDRVPISVVADRLVHQLAADTGSIAGLSRVERDEITNVVYVDPSPRDGPQLLPRLLARLPLIPPMGAVTVAFSEPAVRRAWVERAPDPDMRAHLRRFLAAIREQGVAVWRFDRVGAAIAVRLGEVLSARGGTIGDAGPAVLDVADVLLAMGRQGYMTEDLVGVPGPLPIALIAAPVFDDRGVPLYELELHVLTARVPARTARELAKRVRSDADALTVACGGTPDRPTGTWPWR
jgi:DNA-binding IclR family transcriptional regulator